jgi:hypothetical protein
MGRRTLIASLTTVTTGSDFVFCAMLASICRAAVPPVLRFTDVCPHTSWSGSAMLRATARW